MRRRKTQAMVSADTVLYNTFRVSCITHCRQTAVDYSRTRNRHCEQRGVVPAEERDVWNSEEGRDTQKAADAHPLHRPEDLDHWWKYDQLSHGHDSTRHQQNLLTHAVASSAYRRGYFTARPPKTMTITRLESRHSKAVNNNQPHRSIFRVTRRTPYRSPTLPIFVVPQPSPPTPTVESAQRGYTSSKPVRRLYRGSDGHQRQGGRSGVDSQIDIWRRCATL